MNSGESGSAQLLNKVPEVTLAFWIIKILSTTVGETCADYLAVHAGLGKSFTAGIMTVLLLIVLILQIRAPKYVPWKYWLSVVLLSVVGTQITDTLTDGLGISLFISTAIFSVMLAVVFFWWYQSERTLSIHSVTTRRRELFYWAAILFTFVLGTAWRSRYRSTRFKFSAWRRHPCCPDCVDLCWL